MRLLWKSQLANADEGGEGVVCCVDPIVDMNQMWKACGRIDCKVSTEIDVVTRGWLWRSEQEQDIKKHLMVRDELAMKDGEEYERMTGGWRGLDWF